MHIGLEHLGQEHLGREWTLLILISIKGLIDQEPHLLDQLRSIYFHSDLHKLLNWLPNRKFLAYIQFQYCVATLVQYLCIQHYRQFKAMFSFNFLFIIGATPSFAFRHSVLLSVSLLNTFTYNASGTPDFWHRDRVCAAPRINLLTSHKRQIAIKQYGRVQFLF